MKIYPENISGKDSYKLLCGSIVPRPIAWISTVSKDGINNIAPFSNFMPCSWDPPQLCFSIGPGVDGQVNGNKDTLQNIIDTNEFVFNVATYDLRTKMKITGDSYPPEIDEFKEAGLTPAPSQTVKAPYIKESPIHLECKLSQILPIGKNYLVVGSVLCFNIDDSVYIPNFKIDAEKLQPIGRLSGNYSIFDKTFNL